MEPTTRLYQCILCHSQATVCSKCDRGQIYCSTICSSIARKKSLTIAGSRYQNTFKGKRLHAARQARYRMRLIKIVTHQGSPPAPHHDSMHQLKNKPKETEKELNETPFCCCFCEKPASGWYRHDFLRRRSIKKPRRPRGCSQAP
jgi:hypothetical protein